MFSASRNHKIVTYNLLPGGCLRGEAQFPGDKSISHRAVILSAIANGISEVQGFSPSLDCLATCKALAQLGVKVEQQKPDSLLVHGVGLHGLVPSQTPLDLANSGTGMRLLTGLLAAQAFPSLLVGDKSLMQRPMERVAQPLREMGANVQTEQGKPPIMIKPAAQLTALPHYAIPVVSAQVKSALLLAAIYANGRTTLTESVATRDHFERLLQLFNYPIVCDKRNISILGNASLTACRVMIPGDLSSAAFFMVGALIAPNSSIILAKVGMNPRRSGVIRLLQRMGADITVQHEGFLGTEPIADIQVNTSDLSGIEVKATEVSDAIDEFPILFIAAACAKGISYFRGLGELRLKESDRIQAMVEGLKILGVKVWVEQDDVIIEGGQLGGGEIDAYGDHRISMAFAIAALKATKKVIIYGCENVATSFPGFVATAKQLGFRLEVAEY